MEEAGAAAYDYTATYFLKRQRKVYRRRRRPATAADQGGNDLDPESLPSQLFWNKWNINSGGEP